MSRAVYVSSPSSICYQIINLSDYYLLVKAANGVPNKRANERYHNPSRVLQPSNNIAANRSGTDSERALGPKPPAQPINKNAALAPTPPSAAEGGIFACHFSCHCHFVSFWHFSVFRIPDSPWFRFLTTTSYANDFSALKNMMTFSDFWLQGRRQGALGHGPLGRRSRLLRLAPSNRECVYREIIVGERPQVPSNRVPKDTVLLVGVLLCIGVLLLPINIPSCWILTKALLSFLLAPSSRWSLYLAHWRPPFKGNCSPSQHLILSEIAVL